MHVGCLSIRKHEKSVDDTGRRCMTMCSVEVPQSPHAHCDGDMARVCRLRRICTRCAARRCARTAAAGILNLACPPGLNHAVRAVSTWCVLGAHFAVHERTLGFVCSYVHSLVQWPSSKWRGREEGTDRLACRAAGPGHAYSVRLAPERSGRRKTTKPPMKAENFVFDSHGTAARQHSLLGGFGGQSETNLPLY